MTYCEECKKRLYPENPEVGFTHLKTNRYYAPLCLGCSHQGDKELDDIKDSIENLEAISAMPGRMPRYYHDKFQQLKGHTLNLQQRILVLEEKQPRRNKPSYKEYTNE